MFRCKDVNEHASAYLSKDLSLWKRAQFQLHLFVCHRCRGFIKQFALTVRTLGGLKKSVDPQTVDAQVAVLMREHHAHRHNDAG